jgi:hypothetical protein
MKAAKKKFRVNFLIEEFVYVDVYAENEEEAEEIANGMEREEFSDGDCDFKFLDTYLLTEK